MGVSIVVPAYNAAKYLPAALESVRSQTIRGWELIVVNDGSTDETGAVAEAFAQRDSRIRVLHQQNAGIAGARNRGFAVTRATDEYVMFLDSDDLLEPDALEILLAALKRDPEAVAAHGAARLIDRAGRPLGPIWPVRRPGVEGRRLKRYPPSAPTTFGMLAYANCIPTGAIIIRREQKESVGDFDESLKMAEDYHLWMRLSLLGHIAFVNRVVAEYRRHEGNVTNRRRLMFEISLLVAQKMYNSPDLKAHEKLIILRGYRYHELYRARLNFIYAAQNLLRGRLIEAGKQLQTAWRHIAFAVKGQL